MIAVDTNVLLWGLARDPISPELDCNKVALARKFFAHVSLARIPILVTSQVLAEFLVRNDAQERNEALRQIEGNFIVSPLDYPASILAAKLFSNKNHITTVRAEFGLKRQVVKADINIIATAAAHGATRLIVNDKEFRVLAQGEILVETLEEFVTRIEQEEQARAAEAAARAKQESEPRPHRSLRELDFGE